jgi:hypothetical protein
VLDLSHSNAGVNFRQCIHNLRKEVLGMWRNFVRIAAVVFTAIGLNLAPATAQIQNPIRAAKDAYNKAKPQPQQGQRQPQQSQQGGPQPASSPNQPAAQDASQNVASAAPSADCCSPEAMKKIAASAGFLDIVGVKLGMTPQQATAAIKAYKPGLKIEVLNSRLFRPSAAPGTFARVPHYISAQEPRSQNGAYEYINVEFTTPPNPPLVAKVERYVQFPIGQPVMASNLLESLRKKYGQENFAYSDQRVWVYDVNGKLLTRVPVPQSNCNPGGELPRGGGDPQRDYGQIDLNLTSEGQGGPESSPACVPVLFANARPVGEGIAPNTQLVQMWAVIASGALKYNSMKATHDWLQAEADSKAKQQEDAAKSRTGPKL